MTVRVKNTEDRIKKFPPDRIPFLPTAASAESDKEVFRKYKQGQISIALACRAIAENNGLPWVGREQFLNEYNLIGWAYTPSFEEEQELIQYFRYKNGL